VTLGELNALDAAAAHQALLNCCGSTAWASRMTAARPFASVDVMTVVADGIWSALDEADWHEAFAAHPMIGADKASAWSAQEQSSVATADPTMLDRLATKNREYQTRFGYIFIVCASGRTANEMLTLLEHRLTNAAATEIHVAAEEQRKITHLRLRKLIAEDDGR
jgi:OHCU decarboxylase